MRVAGRRALVTGASGGIGEAVARALAGAGARLVLSGRREDVLARTAGELGARVVVADLGATRGAEDLAAACGDVDLLVVASGLPAAGPLDGIGVEDIDRALTVNVRAPLVLTRLLLDGMRGRGEGHLVYLGSLGSKAPSRGLPLYCATKFALRGFAHSLRQDLAGSGVGVSLVLPGFVSEAGMFAATGVTPPRGAGTRTPAEVGRAVVRAVERNLAEVEVAPVALRVGSTLGMLMPGLAARMQRRTGADRTMLEVAAALRDRR